MATSASTSGEWLTGVLQELRERKEGALDLDTDLISGLVSFCELAPPPDAADYLAVRAPLPKPWYDAYSVRILWVDDLDSDQGFICARVLPVNWSDRQCFDLWLGFVCYLTLNVVIIFFNNMITGVLLSLVGKSLSYFLPTTLFFVWILLQGKNYEGLECFYL